MLRFFGKGKALRALISRTKAQHFFPKIGWGSEAVWKFSENSSNMVEIVVPNKNTILVMIIMTISLYRYTANNEDDL